MNRSKISKILLSSVLSLGVLATSSVSSLTAFADGVASTPLTPSVNKTNPAGIVGSDINIDIETTTVNVDVPSSVPIKFNENGTVTAPKKWTIKNNSEIAGIHLAKISVDGSEKGWKVVDGSKNLKIMPVNTKHVRMKFGKADDLKLVAPKSKDVSAKGEYKFDPTDIIVGATESQELEFNIERGAFTKAEGVAGAFKMELDFKFN